MSKELIVNASLPEIRIALLEDGKVQEILTERPSDKGIVGNIYKGRVTRVLPGMQAAFVDIGLDKAAFLYVDDIYLHPAKFDEDAHEGHTESTDSESNDEPTVEATTSDEATESQESSESSEETQDQENAESLEASVESEEEEGTEEEEAQEEQGAEVATPTAEGEVQPVSSEGEAQPGNEGAQPVQAPGQNRNDRNKRGRHQRGRGRRGGNAPQHLQKAFTNIQNLPKEYGNEIKDEGSFQSDRAAMDTASDPETNIEQLSQTQKKVDATGNLVKTRPEYREQRGRDRRIRPKSGHFRKPQVNIDDLLKEGQEVLVQVAKEPIATKGARLTCHISLAGRHLVCMPTVDHVGVSRRIERDDERRRLRDFVERNRTKKLGFIIRTASSGKDPEESIKQDIDYLTDIWTQVQSKVDTVSAPALVYEDLNPVLRAVRDWVNEDIDKIIIDSRYYYNDTAEFVAKFMPAIKDQVEQYQGDLPIFDAYGISTELHRALERKVWLKSGGYIMIDQAEALVAIDVNTGRFVGKRNLEDTILKTNLEAVEEIAYQLRLRNCGGIIILDLIDMEKEENKQRVYRALDEAIKKDRARPSILKISDLGLVEMTRRRTRDTMVRALCEPCTHCEGKGFVKSKRTVAYEILREIEREGNERDAKKILVEAHPDVIDILAIDERETMEQLERRYRKQIYLQAVMDSHPEQYEVSNDRSLIKQAPQISTKSDERRHRHHSNRNDNNRSGGGRDRGGRDRNRDNNRDRDQNRDRPQRNQQQPQQSVAPVQQPQQPAAAVVADMDSVGNLAPQAGAYVPRAPQVLDDNFGNRAPIVPSTPKTQQEQDAEDDRLAFLRAQAAQDAAIAGIANGNGLGNSYGGQPRNGAPRPGGHNRNNRFGGGRNNRNNRGGPRHHNNRGPQQGGFQRRGPVGGGNGNGNGPVGGGEGSES